MVDGYITQEDIEFIEGDLEEVITGIFPYIEEKGDDIEEVFKRWGILEQWFALAEE